MITGRRPKPSALRELGGNAGHRALNENEPRPETCIPKAPKHLDKEARAEWRRITPELKKLGLVSKIDRGALAGYCVAWSRWVDAETQLKRFGAVIKSPTGYPIQNPYLGIANTALMTMSRFLTEFGMTPSSRSRIHVNEPTAGQSADPWDRLDVEEPEEEKPQVQ